MKASDFITHLQKMIEEHGDLPLAVLEFHHESDRTIVVEVGSIESIFILDKDDLYFDSNDEVQDVDKVFLID